MAEAEYASKVAANTPSNDAATASKAHVLNVVTTNSSGDISFDLGAVTNQVEKVAAQVTPPPGYSLQDLVIKEGNMRKNKNGFYFCFCNVTRSSAPPVKHK